MTSKIERKCKNCRDGLHGRCGLPCKCNSYFHTGRGTD